MEKVENYQELPENYWDVIAEHLPDYYRRDDVLKSDILTRYVNDEEVYEKDLEWLPDSKEEARKQLEELDVRLYNEAIEAKENESSEVEPEEPKVEMDMEEPFGWLMDGDWNWVADYCTSQESYGDLDILYRVLNGDIEKAGEWCEDMTTEEIKRTYSERFPLLLAGVFKNLAEAITSGELKFRISYPQ